MKRLFSVATLAVVATMALAACGSDNSSTTGNDTGGSSSSSEFNDADVTFAQSMIPHHEQAVEMAEIAASNALSPEVKELAENIEAAQGPEIDTMTGWLESWGQDGPSDSMGGMDHDMGSMPGMMSDDDMMGLDAATGAGFDRMFLIMMIEHHEGAIEMARTEQADGENPDAVSLAKKIEDAQTTEIAQMQDLLKP